ncbi:MAG: hypothetical protein GXW96_06055 [Christensenellaceae bacterium]|jgi:hypothetical protein|nr:hypothetical protein [Christensenellaceae bacterium]
MDGSIADNRRCLIDSLCENVDEVVTICTESCCFTGLLCAVTCDCVKLITRGSGHCPGINCFGKVTVIPISQIEAVTFCNTTF